MKTETRPARVTPKIKFLMIDLGTRRWVVVPITDDIREQFKQYHGYKAGRKNPTLDNPRSGDCDR